MEYQVSGGERMEVYFGQCDLCGKRIGIAEIVAVERDEDSCLEDEEDLTERQVILFDSMHGTERTVTLHRHACAYRGIYLQRDYSVAVVEPPGGMRHA